MEQNENTICDKCVFKDRCDDKLHKACVSKDYEYYTSENFCWYPQ